MDVEKSGKLPSIFLLIYALAWSGGTVSYTPFITVLLPVKVTSLAGAEQAIVWTSYISLMGAFAASAGAIFFGYLSDITKNRMNWIYAGIALSCVLLLLTQKANNFIELMTIIVLWQLALNMFLAPLAAFAADNIPDEQKGSLGGLLAFAPGVGAFSATIATYPGIANNQGRLFLVCVLVVLLMMPLLLTSRKISDASKNLHTGGSAFKNRGAVAIRMWFARLAIQIPEAALYSFLFFWLRSIDQSVTDNQTARIFSATMIISAPVALLIGRWTDKINKPILSLVICSISACLSLFFMAIAKDKDLAVLAYGVFGVSSSAFLALHTAQTLSVLPQANRKARDLGLFNLTNTIPSIILPIITLTLVPRFGFSTLFFFLCVLAMCGSLVLFSIRQISKV